MTSVTSAPQLGPELAATPADAAIRGNPWLSFLSAVQFLTRIPTPAVPYSAESLPRALPFFPFVGALLGALAAMLDRIFAAHLGALPAAVLAVGALILVTGALHEDGLADCADAFGLRHSRSRTLEILHDSRIGTFGALALLLSVGLRVLLIASLPPGRALPVLVAALALSRWSPLPLSLLPSASQKSGQGARIAGRSGRLRLIAGTVLAFAIAALALHWHALAAIAAACLMVLLTGLFYRGRLGGVTGDCFGATVQLVELTLLLTGAWHR